MFSLFPQEQLHHKNLQLKELIKIIIMKYKKKEKDLKQKP